MVAAGQDLASFLRKPKAIRRYRPNVKSVVASTALDGSAARHAAKWTRGISITIGSSDDGAGGLEGMLAEAVYLGSSMQYVVALPDGTRITVRRPAGGPSAGHAPLAPGAAVRLSWSAADATVLTA